MRTVKRGKVTCRCGASRQKTQVFAKVAKPGKKGLQTVQTVIIEDCRKCGNQVRNKIA